MTTRSAVLGSQLIEAGWQADENQRRVVWLAADFADGVEWAAAGFSTAARWIAAKLDVTRRTANEWIRIGKALRGLPATIAALESKQISFSKAKVLTRMATSENEADLLAIASRVTAAQLPSALAAWSQRFEPDDVIDRRQIDSRSLRWQVDLDGSLVATLRVPPGQGALLMAAVDTQVMRNAQAPGAPQSTDTDGWSSLAQQRADGLISLLSDGSGSAVAEVVLHVRGDGATLDDGTPITESAVARMVGDGFIRALIHDAEGRPVNASSRQRRPTSRQRRRREGTRSGVRGLWLDRATAMRPRARL